MSARANDGFELTTSLVYQPKTPTSTNPILLVVIARGVPETSSDEDSSSPFPVDQTPFSEAVTQVAETTSVYALHAPSSSSTVFVSRKDIVNHLKSLEHDLTKLAEPGAAATPALQRAHEGEERRHIENAVQHAMDIKKGVYFTS
ncbi:hypothetical protein BKA70DRAFT_1437148 [Coprinopsis sp. MPI-PUGE-AT-0042]|nr:hypothetical protein BKA70DRAFT_1437148 [Coprinopsis sp. MPI-PUGE-AT-0042]